MSNYLNNIIDNIQNFSDKFEFIINNFKTVYILIILIYTACVFILINQRNINRKLDKLLIDNNKSDNIDTSDSKMSKLLVDLVLSILSIIFIIIILLSLM